MGKLYELENSESIHNFFFLTQAHSFMYFLLLLRCYRVVAIDDAGPAKPKILTLWPFIEEFSDPLTYTINVCLKTLLLMCRKEEMYMANNLYVIVNVQTALFTEKSYVGNMTFDHDSALNETVKIINNN